MPVTSTPSPAPRPATPAPAAKPKQNKSNLTIILSVVTAVFAGTSGYLYTQLSSKTGALGAAQESMLKIATAAGSGALKAEDLVNPQAFGKALESLTSDIGALVSNGQAARAEVDRQKTEIADLNSQRQAVELQQANAKSQLDNARKELETSKTALDDLQKKYGDEVSQLNAKVAELTAEVQSLKPADVVAAEAEAAVAADSEMAASEITGEAATPRLFKKEVAEGDSDLFKSATYDATKQTLTLVALNGQSLVYKKVPQGVFDGLEAAPVIDVFFRFKILEQFEADQSDIDFIKALN